jgi:hypothetical protein
MTCLTYVHSCLHTQRLALDYAGTLLPRHAALDDVHAALRLEDLCGDSRYYMRQQGRPRARQAAARARQAAAFEQPHAAAREQQAANAGSQAVTTATTASTDDQVASNGDVRLYVNALHGSDAASGARHDPVRSVERALSLARARDTPTSCILLEPGVHRLQAPLELGPADAGLSLAAAPPGPTDGNLRGRPVLSGGALLSGLVWQPVSAHSSSGGGGDQSGIFAAQLSANAPADFTTLFVNGSAAPRARFPNGAAGNPAACARSDGAGGDDGCWLPPPDAWLPPRPATASAAVEVSVASPRREAHPFGGHAVCVGGAASAFAPPRSYWACRCGLGAVMCSRYSIDSCHGMGGARKTVHLQGCPVRACRTLLHPM